MQKKRVFVLFVIVFIFSIILISNFVSAALISKEVQVYPIMPISSDNLSCNFTVVSNFIQSGMVVNYTWYKNGLSNLTGSLIVDNNTQSSIILLSGNTTENEIWTCNVDIEEKKFECPSDLCNDAAAFYKFDSNGLVEDLSGNGNNGTLHGSPEWMTNGAMGGIYYLDGTNYLSIPDDPSLNLSGALTLSMRVKWAQASQTGWHSLLNKDGDSDYEFFFGVEGGGFDLNLNGEISGYKNYMASTSIADTDWHSFQGVYNVTHFMIYIDGVLDAIYDSELVGGIHNEDGPVTIGYSSYWGNYFNGFVDEVGIWNRSLNSTEIFEISVGYANMNSTVLIRGETSINSAVINWRDEHDYLKWGKLLDKKVVVEDYIYDSDMGSYFGRAPMVFDELGEEGHVIFRDGSYDVQIREFDWSSWTEVKSPVDVGQASSMSIDRYGDTLIAVWGRIDGDTEPPLYSISVDGGSTWSSEELINSSYNKYGVGNTMEFKFLDDGNGIAIWKSYGSGIGWAYAYWNGTGWEHMGLVNDNSTGSVGRADLAILPGAGALLNFQNSSDVVYSWNGTGFDNPFIVDVNGNADSHNGPAIDCNRFGECISVWTQSGNELEYRRYNSSGWLGSEDVDIDGSDSWSDSHGQEITDLEIDDEGDAVLVWYEDTETEVFYAFYNWSNDSWTKGSDFISYIANRSTEYGDGPQIRLIPLVKGMTVKPINITVHLDKNYHITNESINAYCSATDYDNLTINYSYQWYVDDVFYAGGSVEGFANGTAVLINVVNSSETSRGENWKFSCSVSDGQYTSAKVNSSTYILIPIANVNFKKSFYFPTEDLECNFSVYSPEFQTGLTAHYVWYKNNVLESTGSFGVNHSVIYNVTLSNENTRSDDLWICSIMISTGAINGSWHNASSVYVKMKTSISEAFVTWVDGDYNAIWTEIDNKNFTNTIIDLARVVSGDGANLIRFILNPALTLGKLIFNANSDLDLHMYDWNGTGWENDTSFASTDDNSDSYDTARYGKTIIVIWGRDDPSIVPYYSVSYDEGETWTSQRPIDSSNYGKYYYHSGLDFEFLTDGTGILLYRDSGGEGWIYSIWNGSAFAETSRLDLDIFGRDTVKASIAPLPNGEAFIVRRGGVYLNRWNGTAFGPIISLDDSSSGYPGGPEIECNIYGNCLVVHRDSASQIEYLTYDGNSWSSPDVDVDGSDTWSSTYSSQVIDIAMDDYNNSILTWYNEDRNETRWATYDWDEDNWTYEGVLGSTSGLSYGDGPQVELRMPFNEPPILLNMSEVGDYNVIDPLDNLTIEAYIYDIENNFDSATLEWKNQSGSWNSELVWNVSNYDFTTKVNGVFVPSTEGIYTYRFRMYDSEGNMDLSEEQNVTVGWECSWEVTDSLGSFAGWDDVEELGNITLSNLGDVEYSGDCSLDFRISYNLDEGRIYYNDEYLKNSVLYNLNEKESINITIDAEFLSETKEETLYVLFDEVRERSDSRYDNTTATLVSNQAGPYIYGEITTSPTSVYLTDSNFNLNGYIRNVMGSDTPNETNTAYNVSLYWDFPGGLGAINSSKEFVNISDSTPINLPVSVSFDDLASMEPGVNNFSLIAVGYNLSGDLIKNSVGVERLEKIEEINFVCYPESDSICVTSCGYTLDPDCSAPLTTTTVTRSSGGGGGGSASSGPIIEESSESYELMIGENKVFEFVVQNDFDYPMENVRVWVEGAGASEISLSPSVISNIDSGSKEIVFVDLSSKAYQLQETLDLIFTISGYLVMTESEVEIKTSFVQRVKVTLRLLEISREEAQTLVNSSFGIVQEMESLNLSTAKIKEKIKSINESYESVDFLTLKEVAEDLEVVYSAAKSSKVLIEDLEEEMRLSEAMGIDILESKKMYLVAKKAYQRGDFETAFEKLNEARLTYVLETKGKFNLIGYVKYKPYNSLLYFILVFLSVNSLVIFSKAGYYKSKVKKSKNNQNSYLKMMKIAQKDCFEKKKLSMGEYNVAISEYRRKLSNAVKLQIKYEEKLIGLSKLGGSKKALIKERERLMNLVKEVQKDYMVKGKLDSRIYELMLKSYMTRLAEIEEKVVQIEAKKAIRGRKFRKPRKIKNEK